MRKKVLSLLLLLSISVTTFATEQSQNSADNSSYKAKRSYEFGDEEVIGEFGTNVIDVIDFNNQNVAAQEIEISFLDKIQTNTDKEAHLRIK